MTENEIYLLTMRRIKSAADKYLHDNVTDYLDTRPEWCEVLSDLDTTLFMQFEPHLMKRYGTDSEAVWAGMFVMCLEAVQDDLDIALEEQRQQYYEWREFYKNPNKYYGVKAR